MLLHTMNAGTLIYIYLHEFQSNKHAKLPFLVSAFYPLHLYNKETEHFKISSSKHSYLQEFLKIARCIFNSDKT